MEPESNKTSDSTVENSFQVVVIGGGPAGVTAALRARELGASVALIERGRMGGTCTNDGCAPTRVLAKAARLVRDTEQYADYGLVGQAPEVDWPELLAHTQATIYRLHEKKQLIDNLMEAGVAVLADVGEARFVDPHHLLLSDGRMIAGEKVILCAGGRARRLNFPGSEHVLTHSDVWQIPRLPRSVTIVGGAATGCQLASIFAAFGVRVTILDLAPRIIPAEDEAVSAAVAEGFRRRGIEIITGTGGLESVTERTGLKLVHYSMGDEKLTLESEAVILAVGWVGNIEQLNLEAAGVQHEKGSVLIDEYLRTSAPHIYAAGDITGRMMLVQSAEYEARLAAQNAVLGPERLYEHRIVPHGGFTDPEYASVGQTESQAQEGCRDSGGAAVVVIPYLAMDRAMIDGQTEGFFKLVVSRQSRHILGAHVVGEQAVEIVQMVAAGMAAGVRVEQLAELEMAYPTFTAIVGLAARQIVRELGLTPLAPEWRELNRINGAAAEWEMFDE
jgi:pyruvate/2-oxoglutarate dehydrogenase complex dihydrolipoamide dehydrogenase (E3) component